MYCRHQHQEVVGVRKNTVIKLSCELADNMRQCNGRLPGILGYNSVYLGTPQRYIRLRHYLQLLRGHQLSIIHVPCPFPSVVPVPWPFLTEGLAVDALILPPICKQLPLGVRRCLFIRSNKAAGITSTAALAHLGERQTEVHFRSQITISGGTVFDPQKPQICGSWLTKIIRTIFFFFC